MSTTTFAPIPVGTVLNKDIILTHTPTALPKGIVTIHYPARLEAMALDPSKVAEREDRIYEAGQIDLTVSIYKHVTIRIIQGEGEIIISNSTPRQALVRHAAEVMKQTLGFKQSIAIKMSEDLSLRHCGLGSSSGSIAAVASAINELFSRPLSPAAISQLCAQNHGEEIDNDTNHIIPVQCLGGSVVSGNYDGGLLVLAGRAIPIFTMNIPSTLSVVVGIPNDFTHPDSSQLMQQEAENMDGFIETGEMYAQTIAYALVHSVLPELAHGSLKACKELVYQYRWNMGSIRNCSFVLPRINDIAETLRKYQHDPDIALFSLSSVGPGFFALTVNPEKVTEDFEALNMQTITTRVHNGTYAIGDYYNETK